MGRREELARKDELWTIRRRRHWAMLREERTSHGKLWSASRCVCKVIEIIGLGGGFDGEGAIAIGVVGRSHTIVRIKRDM